MNWNFILIEGFCAKDWDYDRKHDKYVYEWKGDEKFEEFNTLPNPDYDPTVVKPDYPDFCEGKICNACIKCEYLAFSDTDDKFRERFDKLVEKYLKEEDEKE